MGRENTPLQETNNKEKKKLILTDISFKKLIIKELDKLVISLIKSLPTRAKNKETIIREKIENLKAYINTKKYDFKKENIEIIIKEIKNSEQLDDIRKACINPSSSKCISNFNEIISKTISEDYIISELKEVNDETTISSIFMVNYEYFRNTFLAYIETETIKIKQALIQFKDKESFELLSPIAEEIEQNFKTIYDNIEIKGDQTYKQLYKEVCNTFKKTIENTKKIIDQSKNEKEKRLLNTILEFIENILIKFETGSAKELLKTDYSKVIDELSHEKEKDFIFYILSLGTKRLEAETKTDEILYTNFSKEELEIIREQTKNGVSAEKIAEYLNDNFYSGLKLISKVDIEGTLQELTNRYKQLTEKALTIVHTKTVKDSIKAPETEVIPEEPTAEIIEEESSQEEVLVSEIEESVQEEVAVPEIIEEFPTTETNQEEPTPEIFSEESAQEEVLVSEIEEIAQEEIVVPETIEELPTTETIPEEQTAEITTEEPITIKTVADETPASIFEKIKNTQTLINEKLEKLAEEIAQIKDEIQLNEEILRTFEENQAKNEENEIAEKLKSEITNEALEIGLKEKIITEILTNEEISEKLFESELNNLIEKKKELSEKLMEDLDQGQTTNESKHCKPLNETIKKIKTLMNLKNKINEYLQLMTDLNIQRQISQKNTDEIQEKLVKLKQELNNKKRQLKKLINKILTIIENE